MNTPHNDKASPVDLPAALERTMGDVDFLRQMLTTFAEGLPEQLVAITVALNAREAEDLAAAAHKLKGTALNLSVGRIAISAALIERVGREGRLNAGPAALARLQQDCDDFATCLAAIDWTVVALVDE